MTSYGSLSGELAELLKEAKLHATDMRGSRQRRNTLDIGMLDIQVPARYHSPLHTDGYGFPLVTEYSEYKEYQERSQVLEVKQRATWAKLHRNGAFDTKSLSQVKKALRKGLPMDLRAEAWFIFSGASDLFKASPSLYPELVQKAAPSRMFQLEISQIFVTNVGFGTMLVRGGLEKGAMIQARHALARLLIAFAKQLNLNVLGNSINVIAASILLVTKDEMRTFWILMVIATKLAKAEFFSEVGAPCCVDQEVLQSILRNKFSKLGTHLDRHGISFPMITASWSASLFVEHLPFETALRVIDTFLFEGRKILIRIGLALFKLQQSRLILIDDPFQLTCAIKELPKGFIDAHRLLQVAFEEIGSLSGSLIEVERARAEPRWSRLPPSQQLLSRSSFGSVSMVTVEIDERASVPEFAMRHVGSFLGRTWSKPCLQPAVNECASEGDTI